MAKIHLILQGKGGVGKSFIAATLAQYKASWTLFIKAVEGHYLI